MAYWTKRIHNENYAPLTDVGDLNAVTTAFARQLATLALEHPDQIHWDHNSIQATTGQAQ